MAASSKAHKINARNDATFEQAAEEIRYDPETGRFWRKMKKTGKWRETGQPGKNKYGIVFVQGKAYKSHRIAWLLITGNWPEVSIDHIDGNPGNNVFTNLRQADMQQQCYNRSVCRQSTSGHTGVHFIKKINKWTAYVYRRNRTTVIRYYLGVFADKDKAVVARQQAAQRIHGDFARLE